MSDKQHLQKAVDELKKAQTKHTEAVNKAAQTIDKNRQEQAEKQSRRS
jgi:prefoldin subunit 5